MVTSSAVVGSSASRTGRPTGERHRDHHALAHAAGELVRIFVRAAFGLGNAHAPQQLDRARLRVATPEALMLNERLGDLLSNAHDRIERRHRFLEYHRYGISPDAAHLGFAKPDKLAAVQSYAAFDPPGRLRHKTHHGERRHALAAAGFTDNPENFAARESPAHIVDRAHRRRRSCGMPCAGVRPQAPVRPKPLEPTGDAGRRHRASQPLCEARIEHVAQAVAHQVDG
jgi:hypothetical protein